MAKKPKNEGEVAEGEEASAAAPKAAGRKKLILIAAAPLILLGGGGAGAYFMFKGESKEAAAPVRKPVSFVDVREMTVNLAPEPAQDRQRFLKFRVALEITDPKALVDIRPLLPRVEDTFQVFVRELRASELEGSAGIYRLREELLRRVNIAVYPAKVDAVLFKDIVVQ